MKSNSVSTIAHHVILCLLLGGFFAIPAGATIISVSASRSVAFLDTKQIIDGTVTNQQPQTSNDPHGLLPVGGSTPLLDARFDNLDQLGFQSASNINPIARFYNVDDSANNPPDLQTHTAIGWFGGFVQNTSNTNTAFVLNPFGASFREDPGLFNNLTGFNAFYSLAQVDYVLDSSGLAARHIPPSAGIFGTCRPAGTFGGGSMAEPAGACEVRLGYAEYMYHLGLNGEEINDGFIGGDSFSSGFFEVFPFQEAPLFVQFHDVTIAGVPAGLPHTEFLRLSAFIEIFGDPVIIDVQTGVFGPAPVPEPSTLVLLGGPLLWYGVRRGARRSSWRR